MLFYIGFLSFIEVGKSVEDQNERTEDADVQCRQRALCVTDSRKNESNMAVRRSVLNLFDSSLL